MASRVFSARRRSQENIMMAGRVEFACLVSQENVYMAYMGIGDKIRIRNASRVVTACLISHEKVVTSFRVAIARPSSWNCKQAEHIEMV